VETGRFSFICRGSRVGCNRQMAVGKRTLRQRQRKSQGRLPPQAPIAEKLLEKSIDGVMTLRIKALQKTKIPGNGPELHSLTSSPSLPGQRSSTYEKELHLSICLF